MIGTTVSHYTILEKIGEGGMGVVYKARDTRLDRIVALKFLPQSSTGNEHSRLRFMREAKAASALDHPSIGVVHDIDQLPSGQLFICMAFYEGVTLNERLDKGGVTESEAVEMILQAARGLAAAHHAGIMHCDIKPANMLLTRDGHVKLLDFGLARLTTEHQTGTTQTSTGGTAAYMSPEQITGGHIDGRSDLFSLGIVFYELLSGRRPFAGDHPAAVSYSIVNIEAADPREVAPDLSPGVASIALRLLQKDPGRRYQTAEELIADLEASRSRGVVAGLRTRTRPRWTSLGAVALGLLLVTSAAWWVTRTTDSVESTGLAVLGFEMVGGNEEAHRYGDGLTETLTERLSHLQADAEGFWVIASSEVQKQKVTAAMEAGRKLGTSFAVEGSIKDDGTIMRVIVQLTDARTGRIVQSKEFGRALASVPQMETEIVAAIADWLGISISPRTSALLAKGGTSAVEAYDDYTKARGYLREYQIPANIDSAIALLNAAVTRDPGFVRAYAALAEAYRRKFDAEKDSRWIDEASLATDRALELNAEVPEAHVASGSVHMAKGQYEDAVSAYRRALSLDPGATDALLGVAHAYDELNDTAKAIAAYRDALTREPTYWGYHNALGVFYYYRSRFPEALEAFREVVRLAPGNTFGLNNVGGILIRLGRYDEAREAFERSLSIDPTATAYSNLGTILFARKQYAESAEMHRKAVGLRSKDHRLWGNLGEALRWSGADTLQRNDALRQAIRLGEEWRRLNPRNPDILHQLAGYYADLGEPQKAKGCLVEALRQSSTYGYGLGRIAMVYEQLGERERALQILRSAFELGFPTGDIEGSVAMEGLRSDERYANLIKELKLER